MKKIIVAYGILIALLIIMNEQQIIQLVKDTISSFTNQSVPWHTHNGIDSNQVNSYDVNTNNNQGFVFGTKGNGVNIQYDPTTDTFIIFANKVKSTTPTTPLIIGNFKSINIEANGTDVGDHTTISFGSSLTSFSNYNATQAEMVWNTGTKIASTTLDGTSARMQWTDGTNIASSVLTGTLQQYLASGNFAIQLPDTSLPSPVAGMIAFNGGQFYKCEVTGTWLNF